MALSRQRRTGSRLKQGEPGRLEIAIRVARRLSIWIPLAALAVWTVLPLLITLSVSLKTRGAVFADPQLIPSDPTLNAYREVITRPGFRGAFFNSLFVGVSTAILTLIIAYPAAYGFARFRFRGRHLLLLFTLLPRLIPGLGLMVPIYRIAVAVGAIDNRLTLIVVFTGTILPLAVWLLVGFIQQVPRELEEAANVDGTAFFARMRYVVIPLSMPALFTIGVLAFREAWNEFGLVLALTRTPGHRTLPYELFLLTTGTGLINNPGQAAFAILTLVPFVFVYLRIERYIVSGLTTGALK